ncbi:MAG: aminoacyl-tRNA hydrolase [bacterium]
MAVPYLIVGLGNPGREYEGTRHNVGFEVADLLADRLQVGFSSGRGDYVTATVLVEGDRVVLAKPTTYMNLSGHAVRDLVAFYKTDMERLLVVVDDVNLPLGTLRLRPEGSEGGHKGLASIICQLGRDDFARLRIGVGREQMPFDLRGFVLDRFDDDELTVIRETVRTAADAAESFIKDGVSETMNRYN